ncbi:MAG: hypothetical protein FWD61_03420 [Phycisphaerales bacterium]|nr:hypothetical protein [Phycisphaerales bacterium]
MTTSAQQLPPHPDSDAILRSVESMIYKIIRRQAGGYDEEIIQELAQAVRISLWQYSIPRYDPSRGVKISTFLYSCIFRKVRSEIRSINKKQKRQQDRETRPLHNSIAPARDTRQDRKIESLADAIVADPEKFMTRHQAEVFRAIVGGHDTKKQDIATQLGYARPSSMSMILQRIRDAIADIDIESWDGSVESIFPPPPPKPKSSQQIEIERRLLAGEDRNAIAATMNTTLSRVGVIAASLGLPKPPPKKSTERLEIERRLQAGQRQCDIVRSLNITRRKVGYVAALLGLPKLPSLPKPQKSQKVPKPPKPPRPPNPKSQERLEIETRLMQGQRRRDIAAEMKISQARVWNIATQLRQKGMIPHCRREPRPLRPFTPLQEEIAVRLHRGESMRRIAREMGISKKRVQTVKRRGAAA